jgi:hypothetical protein
VRSTRETFQMLETHKTEESIKFWHRNIFGTGHLKDQEEDRKINFLCNVACRPVARYWLRKQRPLIGNGHNRFLTRNNGLTRKWCSLSLIHMTVCIRKGGCENGRWIELTWIHVQEWALVLLVLNLWGVLPKGQ